MPHILREMKDKYPGVKVIQHHGNYKEIEYWLEKEKVDVAFLTEYHKGNFHFIPLVQDEYYVILPPEHPLCAYERIPVEALNNETMILMNEGSGDYDAGHILEGLHYTVTHWVNEDVVLIPPCRMWTWYLCVSKTDYGFCLFQRCYQEICLSTLPDYRTGCQESG